jgi:hypothetical protein
VPELKNIRHERFCQLFVLLGNASEAYRQAGYRGADPDAKAGRLAVKDSVISRVAELKIELLKKQELSREAGLAWLRSVIDIPLVDVKPSDQLRAFEHYARIKGWNAPDQLELHAGSTLSKYLSDIRSERERPALEAEVTEVREVTENGE